MKSFEAQSSAGVLVLQSTVKPGTGTVWIIIDNRAAFDLIDLPMTDHGPKPTGHVISKVIDGPYYIIFQHWITRPGREEPSR